MQRPISTLAGAAPAAGRCQALAAPVEPDRASDRRVSSHARTTTIANLTDPEPEPWPVTLTVTLEIPAAAGVPDEAGRLSLKPAGSPAPANDSLPPVLLIAAIRSLIRRPSVRS